MQEKSKSINKSFGIFNAQTLRHCATNTAQDIAGYKSLIARPYESVNRAMPGSYYSDVERTLYLTYYILQASIVSGGPNPSAHSTSPTTSCRQA